MKLVTWGLAASASQRLLFLDVPVLELWLRRECLSLGAWEEANPRTGCGVPGRGGSLAVLFWPHIDFFNLSQHDWLEVQLVLSVPQDPRSWPGCCRFQNIPGESRGQGGVEISLFPITTQIPVSILGTYLPFPDHRHLLLGRQN